MPDLTPQQAFELALQHHQAGRLVEAESIYRQILAVEPNHLGALHLLGVIAHQAGHQQAAKELIGRALAILPDWPDALSNLGEVLRITGEIDAAVACFRRAIELAPHFPSVSNLDDVLRSNDQINALVPKYAVHVSNYLYLLHFLPSYDASAIAAELRCWDRQYAAPLRPEQTSFPNDRSPERRLRIGYVSPDFRDHPVGHFLLPLLEHHDRAMYEVFAYAQLAAPDAMSERLRAHTDAWRSTVGKTDAEVAALIRKDQVDILVDLALHTANNRLLVFAHKPAPVQVTYLAYVGSSGLSTMDYRLSDQYLDPPGRDESIYSEQTIRLQGAYWCYRPTELAALPGIERAQDVVRFGCLSNFCKINAPLVELWAKILAGVPDSRLLMHAYEGDHRQRLVDRFVQQGVAAERIEFVGFMPRAKYFEAYGSLDISLDTLPYAGGTTTCDSLWMGVPVVTLSGERAVGRGGVSILNNVGLPELIAQTPEEYVQIAIALANDRPRLQELHSTLRERMQASSLMDGAKYARHVEAAYRQMWRTWCAQR